MPIMNAGCSLGICHVDVIVVDIALGQEDDYALWLGPGLVDGCSNPNQAPDDLARRWASRYNAHGADTASSVAVSPGGATVFVTGRSRGATSNFDYATVAYNAATGLQHHKIAR